jgi:hypothetical protein
MAFYRNMMKWDILSCTEISYFSDNKNEPDKMDENYDKSWKMTTIFDKLSDAYVKYYNPTEHLKFY